MRSFSIFVAFLLFLFSPTLSNAQFDRRDAKAEKERIASDREWLRKGEARLTAALADRDLEKIRAAAKRVRSDAKDLESADPFRAEQAIWYAKDAETLLELDAGKQLALLEAYDKIENARMLYRKGEFIQSREQLKQSLAVFDEHLGRHSFSSCEVIEKWRAATISTGTPKEANAASGDVLERYSQVFGTYNPRYWSAATSRAFALARDGKAVEAEQIARDALKFNEAFFGKYHSAIVNDWLALASAHVAQGEVKEAREALTKSQQILDGTRGISAGQFEQSMLEVVARIEAAEKQFEKAAVTYEKLIKSIERDAPPNHPAVAAQYEALASVYKELGRDTEAKQLHDKAKLINDALTAKRDATASARR